MYISTLPTAILVLFILSLAFPLLVYVYAIHSAANKAGLSYSIIRSVQIIVIGFFLTWWGYAAFLSINGLLYGNALPPKPVIFLIVPLLLILFLLERKSSLFKKLFDAIPIETLINIHIFRLIGGWFLIMGHYELLPSGFALRTGWGDILSGLPALLTTHLVFKKKSININWAYAWNIFGLLDILAVVASAIVTTFQVYNNPNLENGVLELTRFPFALIPAFAPATLIFLHILTFKKLQQIREKYKSQHLV